MIIEEKNKFIEIYDKIMKNPVKVMRIFGMNPRKDDNNLTRVYQILVTTLPWVIFIKDLSFFEIGERFSAALMLKLIGLIWMFDVRLNGTFLFINQRIRKRDRDLIENFQECFHCAKSKKDIERKATTKINILFGFFFHPLVFYNSKYSLQSFLTLKNS